MLPIFMALALLLKLGAAPFHLWFVSLMQSIQWISCFILSTLQKAIPLTLILSNNLKFIDLFTITSAIMGSMGGLNQTNLKSLLAYSSVSHISWMMSTLNISSLMYLYYLMIYSILIFPIFFIFDKYQIFSIKMMNSLPIQKQTITLILFLSMGGFPPLLGFFPKWVILESLIKVSFLIPLTLISSSILNLYYYIRISYTILLASSSSISQEFFLYSYSILIPFTLSMSLLLLPILPVIY